MSGAYGSVPDRTWTEEDGLPARTGQSLKDFQGSTAGFHKNALFALGTLALLCLAVISFGHNHQASKVEGFADDGKVQYLRLLVQAGCTESTAVVEVVLDLLRKEGHKVNDVVSREIRIDQLIFLYAWRSGRLEELGKRTNDAMNLHDQFKRHFYALQGENYAKFTEYTTPGFPSDREIDNGFYKEFTLHMHKVFQEAGKRGELVLQKHFAEDLHAMAIHPELLKLVTDPALETHDTCIDRMNSMDVAVCQTLDGISDEFGEIVGTDGQSIKKNADTNLFKAHRKSEVEVQAKLNAKGLCVGLQRIEERRKEFLHKYCRHHEDTEDLFGFEVSSAKLGTSVESWSKVMHGLGFPISHDRIRAFFTTETSNTKFHIEAKSEQTHYKQKVYNMDEVFHRMTGSQCEKYLIDKAYEGNYVL